MAHQGVVRATWSGTEEQIAFALKQAETGTPVAEVIRRMAVSEQTFYLWKKVYEHDRVFYKQRSRIERMFGHLKINRAIAIHYDQLARSFLGMVHLATARY